MFFRKKQDPLLSAEQHARLEYAQHRIRKKRKLFRHVVFFLVGAVFLVALNKILHYRAAYNWYLWVLGGWAFLLAVHVVNVYITDRFMGPAWEREQRDKLLRLQQERIAKLEAQIAAENPLPAADKKKETGP